MKMAGCCRSSAYKTTMSCCGRKRSWLTGRMRTLCKPGPGMCRMKALCPPPAFAFGVFNSHLTQGNTNFNVLLSVCTSQFNLAPETGQRIFVEMDGRRYLLGVPSAFEMGLNHCRWIYKHGNSLLPGPFLDLPSRSAGQYGLQGDQRKQSEVAHYP